MFSCFAPFSNTLHHLPANGRLTTGNGARLSRGGLRPPVRQVRGIGAGSCWDAARHATGRAAVRVGLCAALAGPLALAAGSGRLAVGDVGRGAISAGRACPAAAARAVLSRPRGFRAAPGGRWRRRGRDGGPGRREPWESSKIISTNTLESSPFTLAITPLNRAIWPSKHYGKVVKNIACLTYYSTNSLGILLKTWAM